MSKLASFAALSGLVALGACASTGGATPTATSKPGVWLDAGSQYTVAMKINGSQTFFGQSQSFAYSAEMGLEALTGGEAQRWRWTFADLSVDKFDLGEDFPVEALPLKEMSKLIAPLVRLMTVPGFECKVDPTGACMELTNWSTWRGGLEDTVLAGEGFAKFGLMVSPMGQMMFDEDGNPTQRPADQVSPEVAEFDNIMNMVSTITLNVLDGIDTKSAGSMTMAGPWGPFAIQGADLNRVGAKLDYSLAQPLPFNGGALQYAVSRTVESVDRGAGTALVTTKADLDGKALFASLLKMFDALVTPNLAVYAKFDPENGPMASMMAAMARTQIEAALKDANFTLTMTSRGTVDLKTGLARDVRTDYEGAIKGGGDFDWIEGSFKGDYVITITPGAPQIERLVRREVRAMAKPPVITDAPGVAEEVRPPSPPRRPAQPKKKR